MRRDYKKGGVVKKARGGVVKKARGGVVKKASGGLTAASMRRPPPNPQQSAGPLVNSPEDPWMRGMSPAERRDYRSLLKKVWDDDSRLTKDEARELATSNFNKRAGPLPPATNRIRAGAAGKRRSGK